jgi:hypothetical protein
MPPDRKRRERLWRPSGVVRQNVSGSGNIWTGTGDIRVVQRITASTDERERNQLELLALRVHHDWVRSFLQSGVHGGLVELAKAYRHDAVARPWQHNVFDVASTGAADSTNESLSAVYQRSGRKLLILGDAGAGKTVAMVDLVGGLLTVAHETDYSQPVPVILSLSSYRPDERDFRTWVRDSICEYDMYAPNVEALLDGGRLCLFFDGLDEVEPAHQSACVDALNHHAESVALAGLAVTCRSDSYSQINARLDFSAAIELLPLTDEQIDHYLQQLNLAESDLALAIRTLPEWRAIVRSPLSIDVAAVAFKNERYGVLKAHSEDTSRPLRDKLFDEYITRTIRERGRSWSPGLRDNLRASLGTLALQMRLHDSQRFHPEHLQPSWLPSSKSRRAYAFFSRFFASLVIALAGFGLNATALAIGVALSTGWVGGALASRRWSNGKLGFKGAFCIVVLSSVLLPWGGAIMLWRFAFGDESRDLRLPASIHWSWLRTRRLLRIWGSAAVSLAFVFAGYSLGAEARGAEAPLLVAVGALIVAVILTLAFGGFTKRELRTRKRADDGIRLSVRLALSTVTVSAITAAGVGHLAPDQATQIYRVFRLIGINVAMVVGGFDLVCHLVLRVMLVVVGAIPRRIARVLDAGVRAILLQDIAGRYQFVHGLLRDFLADEAALAQGPLRVEPLLRASEKSSRPVSLNARPPRSAEYQVGARSDKKGLRLSDVLTLRAFRATRLAVLQGESLHLWSRAKLSAAGLMPAWMFNACESLLAGLPAQFLFWLSPAVDIQRDGEAFALAVFAPFGLMAGAAFSGIATLRREEATRPRVGTAIRAYLYLEGAHGLFAEAGTSILIALCALLDASKAGWLQIMLALPILIPCVMAAIDLWYEFDVKIPHKLFVANGYDSQYPGPFSFLFPDPQRGPNAAPWRQYHFFAYFGVLVGLFVCLIIAFLALIGVLAVMAVLRL